MEEEIVRPLSWEDVAKHKFKNLYKFCATYKNIIFQGNRLRSLYLTYNVERKRLTIEVNSRAERVSNYFRNRYGTDNTFVVLNDVSMEDYLDHLVDIDNFVTILYDK
jgi:hypothetical protein